MILITERSAVFMADIMLLKSTEFSAGFSPRSSAVVIFEPAIN
jgi:hypothetical protein